MGCNAPLNSLSDRAGNDDPMIGQLGKRRCSICREEHNLSALVPSFSWPVATRLVVRPEPEPRLNFAAAMPGVMVLPTT